MKGTTPINPLRINADGQFVKLEIPFSQRKNTHLNTKESLEGRLLQPDILPPREPMKRRDQGGLGKKGHHFRFDDEIIDFTKTKAEIVEEAKLILPLLKKHQEWQKWYFTTIDSLDQNKASDEINKHYRHTTLKLTEMQEDIKRLDGKINLLRETLNRVVKLRIEESKDKTLGTAESRVNELTLEDQKIIYLLVLASGICQISLAFFSCFKKSNDDLKKLDEQNSDLDSSSLENAKTILDFYKTYQQNGRDKFIRCHNPMLEGYMRVRSSDLGEMIQEIKSTVQSTVEEKKEALSKVGQFVRDQNAFYNKDRNPNSFLAKFIDQVEVTIEGHSGQDYYQLYDEVSSSTSAAVVSAASEDDNLLASAAAAASDNVTSAAVADVSPINSMDHLESSAAASEVPKGNPEAPRLVNVKQDLGKFL